MNKIRFTKEFLGITFDEILCEANYPPITLVDRKVFQTITGCKIDEISDGMSSSSNLIIWINKNQQTYKELKDSIWHEILHCLFPYNPEWWIECCAYKLSKNDSLDFGFYAHIHSKTLKNNVPSRKMLLEMIKDVSSVMKRKMK